MRQVVVYPGESGFWVAECPSLPGCISQGETRQEAIANIKEAIEGYILALQEDGLPVPEERFEALCWQYDPTTESFWARFCTRALGKAGFYLVRQHSSHMILRRDVPFAQVVVPDHRELDSGTLRSVIRRAGLSVTEFNSLL